MQHQGFCAGEQPHLQNRSRFLRVHKARDHLAQEGGGSGGSCDRGHVHRARGSRNDWRYFKSDSATHNEILNEPFLAGGAGRIKPAVLDSWRVFVQSTSYNRALVPHTGFLYEVDPDR